MNPLNRAYHSNAYPSKTDSDTRYPKHSTSRSPEKRRYRSRSPSRKYKSRSASPESTPTKRGARNPYKSDSPINRASLCVKSNRYDSPDNSPKYTDDVRYGWKSSNKIVNFNDKKEDHNIRVERENRPSPSLSSQVVASKFFEGRNSSRQLNAINNSTEKNKNLPSYPPPIQPLNYHVENGINFPKQVASKTDVAPFHSHSMYGNNYKTKEEDSDAKAKIALLLQIDGTKKLTSPVSFNTPPQRALLPNYSSKNFPISPDRDPNKYIPDRDVHSSQKPNLRLSSFNRPHSNSNSKDVLTSNSKYGSSSNLSSSQFSSNNKSQSNLNSNSLSPSGYDSKHFVASPYENSSIGYFKSGGFVNLGNTCYINAVLQSIFHNVYFKDKINNTIIEELKSCPIYRLIVELYRIRNMCSKIDITPLKDAIGNKCNEFSGFTQQDAHEFLLKFLELISDETNPIIRQYLEIFSDEISLKRCLLDKYPGKPSNSPIKGMILQNIIFNKALKNDEKVDILSPINDCFQFKLRSNFQCSFCNYLHSNLQTFYDLSLDLDTKHVYAPDLICKDYANEKSLTVASLISGFFSPNVLNMKCSNTNITCGCLNSVAFTTLDSIPKILILHLKRFKILPANYSEDGAGHSNKKPRFVLSKINADVILSPFIDMSLVSSDSAIQEFSKLKHDFLRNELLVKESSKDEVKDEILFDDILMNSHEVELDKNKNQDLNTSIDKNQDLNTSIESLNGTNFTESDLQLVISSARCEEFFNLSDEHKLLMLQELKKIEMDNLLKMQNSRFGLRGGNPRYGGDIIESYDQSQLIDVNDSLNKIDKEDMQDIEQHVNDEKASRMIKKIVEEHTLGYLKLLNGMRASAVYTLTGIVHHIGNSPHHGHYVADIMNDKAAWTRYDDSKIEESVVFGKESQKSAYILVYSLSSN